MTIQDYDYQIDIIVNSLYAKFGKFMKLIGTII